MFTVFTFVAGVAWLMVVTVAAIQHGRAVSRPYRVAAALAVLGVLLVLPALFIGAYGLPANWPHQRLGFVARLGSVGLVLAAAGAGAWMLLDTAFVWRERRRVFPFAFRRPPESQA
jgi:hypothetical protein